MAFKFWQRTPDSIENLCAFVLNTCGTCARYWNPNLRDAARPFCVHPSFFADMAQRRADVGHPFDSSLPEWSPLDCTYHMDK